MGVDTMMFVTVDELPDERELRRLSARLCQIVGADMFHIHRPGEKYSNGDERPPEHALEVVGVGDQSSWYLINAAGRYDTRPRVRARLASRYYGEGYERGHCPTIACTAMVLRELLADRAPVVYYGGDNQEHVRELTAERVREIWAHAVSDRGNAYRESSERLCDFCGVKMFWGSVDTCSCSGCGAHWKRGVLVSGRPWPDGARLSDHELLNQLIDAAAGLLARAAHPDLDRTGLSTGKTRDHHLCAEVAYDDPAPDALEALMLHIAERLK